MSRTRRYDRDRVRSLGLVALLVAATTAGVAGHSAATDWRDGFVYRDGATLMLDGSPYRFVGVNNYDLTGCHTGTPLPEEQADLFFASLPPQSVTRVWAFEQYGIDAVEQTIRSAERHDQKLILALADGAEYCNSPDYDAAWYAGGYRTSYLPWITRVSTAFRDSPAVAIWELMNEPGQAGGRGLTSAMMKSFYDTAAGEVKRADDRHLVSTGALAPWQDFQSGELGYTYVHSGPDIDAVSVHEYDFPYSNGEIIASPHFRAAQVAAAALDKPVYVGEAGISLQEGCITAEQRAAALHRKFDEYLSSGAAGVLYWVVVGPPNRPGTICNAAHGNHDPMTGGPIMSLVIEYGREHTHS